MKRYLIYILSAYAGLVFRTFLSTLSGEGYHMNGLDILNAVICLLIAFLIVKQVRAYREREAERQALARSNTKQEERQDAALADKEKKAA